MREFKLTETDREEIIYLLNNHSVSAAKRLLMQLEEIKQPVKGGKKESGI